MSLFQHALRVTTDNDVAHTNLGFTFARQGDEEKALKHYHRAIDINPRSSRSWNNLGAIHAGRKEFDKALDCYQKAAQLEPNEAEFYNNQASAWLSKGEIDQADAVVRKALELNPTHFATNNLLGLVLLQQGNLEEAHRHFSSAYRAHPTDPSIRNNFLLASKLNRQVSSAFDNLLSVMKLGEEPVELTRQAESIFLRKRELCRAIQAYQKAISLQPGFNPDHLDVNFLIDIPTLNQAYIDLQLPFLSEIQRYPDNVNLSYHLTCIYAIQGDDDTAIKWLFSSLRHGLTDLETLKMDFHLKRIVDAVGMTAFQKTAG